MCVYILGDEFKELEGLFDESYFFFSNVILICVVFLVFLVFKVVFYNNDWILVNIFFLFYYKGKIVKMFFLKFSVLWNGNL